MTAQLHSHPWRHNRPAVMGILNVTPDSFSDGGRYLSPAELDRRVAELIDQGADIIDIGGESTRPFAEPVSLEEELQRVLPAVETVRRHAADIPISIDTTKAEVARRALELGANIINDISALRFDPEMVAVAREFGCPVIVMHMQGEPRTMQQDPRYGDVVTEVRAFLAQRVAMLRDQGIEADIIVDPGIGFGKTLAHNLSLLKHLARFQDLGCPVLVGHSRKSFLAGLLDLPVDERDEATALVSAWCLLQGADILRVHDVGRTQTVRTLLRAITTAP